MRFAFGSDPWATKCYRPATMSHQEGYAIVDVDEDVSEASPSVQCVLY